MFRRIGNLIRGFFGLFVSGMERRNPEALLEVEQENLRSQIARFNQGLAAHAGMCERLMTQVKKLEQEESDLRDKTKANLRAGNRAAAGEHAVRLQTITRELAENRTQLEGAEKTYEELVAARDASVKAAREKIESLKRDLSDMKMQKAVAELNEMASGMVTTIGGSGDTLDRLHKMVEEEREKAAGRARVARDSVDLGAASPPPGEKEALADLALADFAAAEGMDIAALGLADSPAPLTSSTPASEEPQKTSGQDRAMGPGESDKA